MSQFLASTVSIKNIYGSSKMGPNFLCGEAEVPKELPKETRVTEELPYFKTKLKTSCLLCNGSCDRAL